MRDTAIIVAVTIACLTPFLDKAFHIDEPLFLWSARQIQAHPADFFGFDVNWNGTVEPMYAVTKNPPLACYYLAISASAFGWSEIALHAAFLIPAIAAALGAYFVARRFCAYPLIAALAAILAPVFVVSSTTIMCDAMMLAFWCWAAVCWLRGIDRQQRAFLLLAAILAGLAALTKYFGIALAPLLLVYALEQRRRLGLWTIYLAVPVAVLLGYQWLTHSLYGQGLFSEAARFATAEPEYSGWRPLARLIAGLFFIGGCLASASFLAPFLWSRRTLTLAALCTALGALALTMAGPWASYPLGSQDEFRWRAIVHVALLAASGVGVLALCVAAARRRDSWFLALWVAGVIGFAVFVNWTVNARSLLPAAPGVGILLARRIEQRGKDTRGPSRRGLLAGFVLAFALAMTVAWGDYQTANSARAAARRFGEKHVSSGRTAWFDGHWGFQYYMESAGARAVDHARTVPRPGELLIVPTGNTFVPDLPKGLLTEVEEFSPPPSWAATMSPALTANFYAEIWGPFPFVLGSVPPDPYHVYVVR